MHYRLSRIRMQVFCVSLLLAAATSLSAQLSAPKVSGATFGYTDPFVLGEEIQFTPQPFPPAAKQPGRYEIYLNGIDVTSSAAIPLVPVGPNPPPGGWPSAPDFQYPFTRNFANQYNLMAPVVTDVYDTLRGSVVRRTRTLLYDRRWYEFLMPQSTLPQPRGVGVQLTQWGLDLLEDLHTLTLPRQSLEQFNAALEQEVASASNELETDTDLFNGLNHNEDRICFGYGSVQDVFPPTMAPVSIALADATAQYALYETLSDALSNGTPVTALGLANPVVTAILAVGLQVAVDNACVKELPNLSQDFEICFGRLEGELTDADLLWVNSVDLALSTNSGQIDANPVELGAVQGTAHINLRDAFIRYQAGGAACGVPGVFHRPQNHFDDDTTFINERYTWAQCPNVTFSADSAINRIPLAGGAFDEVPVELQMSADAGDPERVDFDQVSLSTVFDLVNEDDVAAINGACALSTPLQDDAETLASAFYPIVEAALGTTWDQLSPTRHAQAMDLLFESFEVGAYEPASHSISWPVIETGTDEDFPYPAFLGTDGRKDVNGLFALMDAAGATPRPAAQIVPPVNNYVQQHWGNFANAYPTTALWNREVDGDGKPYDVAMVMSVNALNQILGAQMSTAKLRFDIEPAGVTLPGLPVFDKAITRIRVQPNLTPFLFISPEPHPVPGIGIPSLQEVPMALHLADLQVTLGVALDPGKPKWIEAVRFAVDVHDLDVQLQFSDQLGKETLDFIPGDSPQVDIIPLYSKIPLCQIKSPVGRTAAGPNCLAGLTADVLAAVEDEVLDRLYSMLEEIPAPQHWDPDNPGRAFVQVEHLSNQTMPGPVQYVVFGRMSTIQE